MKDIVEALSDRIRGDGVVTSGNLKRDIVEAVLEIVRLRREIGALEEKARKS